MSSLKIYACGGLGANIGAHFVKFADKKSEGFADIETYFIDTSKSNLSNSIPSDKVYLVEGADGSGKKRDTNYTTLSERSKGILHSFKPGDANIVVHSASGGTGSVVGPILVSELLNRGELVIVVTVGSTGSQIETENSLKTLKSYEVIAQKRGVPVVASYRENSVNKPRGHVDNEIQTFIVLLASIFSGSNRELDSEDLRNFIYYNRVTTFQPKLSLLDFFSKDIELGRGESLISLLTLTDDKTSGEVDILAAYRANGFIPDSMKANIGIDLPIHSCIIGGHFNVVVDALEAKLSSYKEANQVVVEKFIAKDNGDATDEGLVL